MQGFFRHATVRPPQLPVDDTERADLRRLAEHAGLIRTGSGTRWAPPESQVAAPNIA